MKDSIPENLEKYYKSIRKPEITQQKMGRRLEQIIHKKGDPKGQNTKIHIRRYVTLLLVPGAIQIKTALKYYHLHPLPWLKFIRLLTPAVCKLVGTLWKDFRWILLNFNTLKLTYVTYISYESYSSYISNKCMYVCTTVIQRNVSDKLYL